MTIVAHAHPFVIGVDTHARNHALSILVAMTGAVVDEGQFPATEAGMARAIDWVGRRTGGDLAALWVIECAGSYGAGLVSAVAGAGYQAVEAARMNARANRGVGKSDPLDARRIAASVLPLETDHLRHPRRDNGVRAALRVLIAARDMMTSERTSTINALTALLRSFPLGLDVRNALTTAQVAEVAKWRTRVEDIAAATARSEATRLAKRITDLGKQITENTSATTELVKQSPARGLLEKTGVGPITAAVVLSAWSHDGRLRDEAAFASLAGVNPIPASSGNTVRHRLNRGGDRRLNRALHMAAVTRMAHHPATRAYVERRRAEGRTPREIRRVLKRYLARQLYRQLTAATRAEHTPQPAPRGLDRHRRITVIIDLTPVRDRTGTARLLDMVEGRSKQVFKDWLAARPESWRKRVEVVAMDGFSGFKTATAEEIPEATTVMDPFYVGRLAADALDRCRRRVQQQLHGHRGRSGDPLLRQTDPQHR